MALASSVETSAYQSGDLWGAALRLFLALVVVAPLAYLLTRYYSRRAAAGGGRALSIIDGIGLGPNKSICLVEVGDRILVVGATPQQINVLAELDDPELIRRLMSDAQRQGGPAFSQALGDAIRRMRGGKREDSGE